MVKIRLLYIDRFECICRRQHKVVFQITGLGKCVMTRPEGAKGNSGRNKAKGKNKRKSATPQFVPPSDQQRDCLGNESDNACDDIQGNHLGCNESGNEPGDFEMSIEMDLFQRVADATGDTLEAVCSMREEERAGLIAVLGLAITQVASVPTTDLTTDRPAGHFQV